MNSYTRFVFVLGFILAIRGFNSYSQVSINTDGSLPDNSAILDVKSSDKGILLPRLTTNQILNIPHPAIGLIAMSTDSLKFYFFDGSAWRCLSDAAKTINNCGIPFEYEGKTYTTIQIGTQCWMKQNLDVGIMIQGTTAQSNNSVIEKHCYDNVEDSCEVYGGLYQWDEMMQYVNTEGACGICPPGFHIPAASEWDALTDYLGGATQAGGKLKTTGFRFWNPPNTGASDLSGFSAKGAGTFRPQGYNYFYLLKDAGIYWTSSMNGSYYVWRRDLNSQNSDISPYSCEPFHSFSVRCIKD